MCHAMRLRFHCVGKKGNVKNKAWESGSSRSLRLSNQIYFIEKLLLRVQSGQRPEPLLGQHR